MTLDTNNNEGINEEELEFIFSSLKMAEVIILGNICKGRNHKEMQLGKTFFHAEQTKNTEYKALNWTKIYASGNIHNFFSSEFIFVWGFITKCGEKIGEKLIPRF